MELNVKQDCIGVDWSAVSAILKTVGMAYHEPEALHRAFEASHTTVFIYRAGQLIGFGRAISDGVYQAAIYDCAVLPEFQGKGHGATLMKNRKMKTGMAHFKNSKSMKERGFTE
jgi:ribosomal protein S18 acetylase RimI-like enzyme